jgi:thiopeptide-type bacteriocin biosynthesis protein
VLTEATLAASVLLRTSTQPFGTAAWMDYQARFLSRYGPGALVPVRELLAESGLGYPTGYLGAPRARPAWRTWTERDAVLAALIQEALISGADEVNLTDGDIDKLTVGDHGDVVPPERIEIGISVLAPTPDAVNRGRFQLRITSAPRVPTSMAGRFAALLDEPDRTLLAATYPTHQDDTMTVQLSFPPRRPRNDNIVRTPPLLPDVLSLSEHPVPGLDGDLRLVGVDDLAVTADATQLYLVHIPTGRRVSPRVPHALDTQVHTPPMARFIAEVAEARSAVFRGFDLGSARTLPSIPRIRYHRTILCPARWLLAPDDLRGQHGFDEAMTAWRQRWRVPAQVVLYHGELRTPLDLEQQLDRELLRAQLHRADRVELHEANPPEGDGWIGRPAELLIPMTALHPSARPLPATSPPGTVHRPGNSAVLHAQLIGNPARFDEIITTHLPRLVDALGNTVARWWMRRHRDMIRPDTDQHIAIVVRLATPSDYGAAAAVAADFAADLAARGLPHHLLLASHHEHTPRYGTGSALEAAERVFAADTTAARAQITAATESGIPAQAWAAASMTRLAAAFAPDPTTGRRALLACLPQAHGPLDRRLREHAVTLATDVQAARVAPGGTDVIDAWTARDVALAAYHRALAAQRDPAGVLRTLLHEHHIRAVGVDPILEQETGRLARAAAQRRLALADVQ